MVGTNNTGKTTFLEALTFHRYDGNNKRFLDSEKPWGKSTKNDYFLEGCSLTVKNLELGKSHFAYL